MVSGQLAWFVRLWLADEQPQWIKRAERYRPYGIYAQSKQVCRTTVDMEANFIVNSQVYTSVIETQHTNTFRCPTAYDHISDAIKSQQQGSFTIQKLSELSAAAATAVVPELDNITACTVV